MQNSSSLQRPELYSAEQKLVQRCTAQFSTENRLLKKAGKNNVGPIPVWEAWPTDSKNIIPGLCKTWSIPPNASKVLIRSTCHSYFLNAKLSQFWRGRKEVLR